MEQRNLKRAQRKLWVHEEKFRDEFQLTKKARWSSLNIFLQESKALLLLHILPSFQILGFKGAV